MKVTDAQLSALRVNAKKAVTTASRASLDLSRMVWETRNARVSGQPDTRPWQHWGYESWEAYLKVELQMSVGTAINHLRIWEVFGIALKGKWNVKNVLPCTKMSIISMMALNVPDVNELLINCQNKSVPGIKAMVAARDRGVRVPVDLITSTLTATRDWLEEYLQHLSTIRLALGPYSRAEIVMMALRFFVKNEPSIRGLKTKAAKNNNPPSTVPKLKRGKTARKRTTQKKSSGK